MPLFECADAEALDAGEDVVGALGPAEWLWLGVGRVDVRLHRLFEVADRAEHAAFQGALGEQGEEALDLLIHDADVGVKCTCQRGRFANQLRMSLVLCVP